MPFTATKLDTGFSAAQMPLTLPEITPPKSIVDTTVDQLKEVGYWGLVTNPLTGFATGPLLLQQRYGREIQAATEMENDIYNGIQLLTRPEFPEDPNFDVMKSLKDDGLWDDFRMNFVNVRSAEEYKFVAAKIAREEENRQVLARAGIPGILFGMTAGLVSPTSLLPFSAGGKGILAFGRAALLGGVAGALQEIPLQANQLTRTAEETAWSIAGSAILTGVLGGAARNLSPRKIEELGNWIDDVGRGMANQPRGSAISDSLKAVEEVRARHADELAKADTFDVVANDAMVARHAQELQDAEEALVEARRLDAEQAEVDDILRESLGGKRAMGADAIQNDAGALKGMLGIGEKLARIAGPVTSNLGQRISAVGRRMTAELSTAGLRLERNVQLDSEGNVISGIPSNSGGTIESVLGARRGDVLTLRDFAYKNFADYQFGRPTKGPLRDTRAVVKSMTNRGKLNRQEFFEEVGKSMRRGDVHEIPEVQAVAQAYRKYYDKLLDEAIDAGIISTEQLDLLGDVSFLNRVYDQVALDRDPVTFTRIVADHMNKVLQEDFAKARAGYMAATARDTERLADMDMPLEDAVVLHDKFNEELKALDSMEDDEVGPIEDLITDLRSDISKAGKRIKELELQLESGPQNYATRTPIRNEIAKLRLQQKTYKDGIANFTELGGKDLEERAARRSELKRRIRNLNRNKYFIEEKARAKFEKIEALEEENLDALRRAASAGQRALRALDKDSAGFDQELGRLQKDVARIADKTRKLDDQIDALHEEHSAVEGAPPVDAGLEDEVLRKIWTKEAKSADAIEAFNEASDDLESFLNIERVEGGREAARGAIRDVMDASLARINRINTKRAQRMAKLQKGAEYFDAKAWAKKREEIAARIPERKFKTIERLRESGADDVDLEGGTADFNRHAIDIAQAALRKIRGTNVRLAGFDALVDKRGTELARSLSVPSEILQQHGYLINDAEQLMQAYHNTLVPDIEITKRLGPYAPDGDLNLQFKELNEEEHAFAEALDKRMRAENAKAKKPLGDNELAVKIGDAQENLSKEYKLIRENLDAIIRRLRRQYGLPTNPDGWAARGVTIANSLQGLRFLGMVLGSSLPDMAKPVFRYGLARTAGTAWKAMITDWKALKMTADDARRAFVAVEYATADRAHALIELIESGQRRSGFEKGLTWATSKMGIVALFAQWTDLMKTLNSVSLNAKLMDSLEMVVLNKGRKTKHIWEPMSPHAEATEFLNSLGWDDATRTRIYNQMTNGGAVKRNGVWVPQTDAWTDEEAVKAFRAALYHENSASIITPGVEVPKMMNSNLVGKVVFNLKSFAMASTSKTLMAGLQQRDMAVANGVMIMLALGALSVYLKAQLLPAEARERMAEWTPQQWFNRSLDASGLMGVIQLATTTASDATAGFADGDTPPQEFMASLRHTLGAYNTGRPADSLLEDLFGANVDLATTLAAAATSGHWTPGQVHRVRQLLPLQNLFYLRGIFDQIENSVGGDI